jgi:hypothetical protein
MTERSGNELLDLLPAAELGRLLDSSQTVSMSLGEIVFQQDGPVPYAYFPTTSGIRSRMVSAGSVVVVAQERCQLA